MKLDLTGRRFGRLMVRRFAGHKYGRRAWLCECDCGKETVVPTATLTAGNSTSCGCKHGEQARRLGAANKKHGHAGNGSSKAMTRPYRIWRGMFQRCNNPKSRDYRHYGGRGIFVCERWAKYENFFADMGWPPSDKHSIDRIDNDGPYSSENCRWVTASEQLKNRRKPAAVKQGAPHG